MRRPYPGIALVAALALGNGPAHAQARGPAAADILATGQDMGTSVRPGMGTRRVAGWRDIPIGDAAPDPEWAALGAPGELDAATREARLAQLDAWLRKLAGRYRIEGLVETPGHATVQVVGASNAMEDLAVATTLSGKISGVADCAGVGDGAGLHCIINATWPVIDVDVAKIGAKPTISEALKTFQPAMLDLGMNRDPPGIRALLVTDDSISHMWAGRLDGDTLVADRLNDCKSPTLDAALTLEVPDDPRCLQPLKITAGPAADAMTIVLRTPLPAPPPWAEITDLKPQLTITLAMHRDDDVSAESLRQEKERAKEEKRAKRRGR